MAPPDTGSVRCMRAQASSPGIRCNFMEINMATRQVKTISVKEFISSDAVHKLPELKSIAGFEQLLGRFNGGTFMECHEAVYKATGVWIEELVPVFQRFDALLAARNLNPTHHA
jgi:hypothetical protein